MSVLHVDDAKMVLCANCLSKLYGEIGSALGRLVKTGDTMWELTYSDDGGWSICPMVVKSVCLNGALRQVKNQESFVWNIYAESDCAYMYASFDEIGKTMFFSKEAACEALRAKIQEGQVG